MGYKWCVVPLCKNSSIKTPSKVFISVPKNPIIRRKWLQLSRRKPDDILTSTNVFICEDHFDLPNDMENYMKFKIMGGVKQIRMKKGCVPTRFDCQPNRNSTSLLVHGNDAMEVLDESFLGTESATIITPCVIYDVPEVEPDQPEYWYPDECSSLPESNVPDDVNNESSNEILKPKIFNPNSGFSEEYQRFLYGQVLNPPNKITKVAELTSRKRVNRNCREKVKEEIEDITIKKEYVDVEDQARPLNGDAGKNFTGILGHIKTEDIEVSDVFFTATNQDQKFEKEQAQKISNTNVSCNIAYDDEATDSAPETEYYFNEEENKTKRRINKRGFIRVDIEAEKLKTEKEDPLKLPEEKPLNKKIHRCKYCSYSIDSEASLQEHLESVHYYIQKYACDYCPYTTLTKTSLTSHLLKIHPEKKHIKCDYCEFRTNRACNIKNHIRCVHLKVKPYKCDQCNYETHHKHSLEQHLNRNHRNIGIFKCKHCDYRTDYKTSLKKHTKTEHVNLKSNNSSV